MSTNQVLESYVSLRRAVALISASQFKALEFGPKQMQILYRLTLSEASMGDLAADTHTDKAAITRAVTSLEEAGWVQRVELKSDRRKVVVELTKAGRVKAAKAVSLRRYIGARLSETITGAEQKELARLLGKVVQGLQKSRVGSSQRPLGKGPKA